MQVYLAGKIQEHESDWRRDIVHDVATYDAVRLAKYDPDDKWASLQLEWDGNCNQGSSGVDRWSWPIRHSLIPDVDITGPFFIEGEGHDGMHGSGRHGTGEYGGWHQSLSSERQFKTTQLCRMAINASDLIYVWLGQQPSEYQEPPKWNSAYGTIFEMGFAAALGKTIVVAREEPIDGRACNCTGGHDGCICGSEDLRRELWFPLFHAKHLVQAGNAKDGLLKALDLLNPKPGIELCESPPERAFFTVAEADKDVTFTPQHKVGRYRLDFAIIDKKIAVEVDGLTYHNGQESFIRDQQRQRDLQALGWRVIRFAAKEVTTNPAKCLAEVKRFAA